MAAIETYFEWTLCQKNAIQDITDWSYDRHKLFWALVGPAGTGKSTVIKECLLNIKQKYGICVSAPTHKAKDVIHQFTGEDAFTVQKLLGLRPNLEIADFDIHKLKFERNAIPKIREYKVVIIDEASMLSTELVLYLKEQATKYKTKLLFVGDKLQLPPVNEDTSPALDVDNLHGVSELVVPVRQSLTNPLSLLLLALRCDIEFNDYNYDLFLEAIKTFDVFDEIEEIELLLASQHGKLFQWLRTIMPVYMVGNEGYRFTQDFDEVIDAAVNAFNEPEFQENEFHAKYIAYNNVEVEKHSTAIRNVLAGTREPLVIGELLTSYSNIVTYPDLDQILINSEDYRVISIQPGEEDELEGWDVILQAIRTGREVQRFIVNPSSYDVYIRQHRPIHQEALNRWKWHPYYKWKNNLMLLNDLNKKFADTKLPSKDLGYIYGSTVHKSQGSTYGRVFVNGKNIGNAYAQGKRGFYNKNRCEPTEEDCHRLAIYCRRLMYVALSRASLSAIIYL